MTAGVTAVLLISGCRQEPVEPTAADHGFAKGADISWVTEMESQGMMFYNKLDQKRECTELMKELGFNSIRLRVWVNPASSWNSAQDVLIKARRASALGMRLMIDFHYSDSWADPGQQTKPNAWKKYTVDQLASAVATHTGDVLKLLKDNAIDVEWVQVGNEVDDGFLWESCRLTKDPAAFAKVANAGYDAVKEAYPDAKVIMHRGNGHERDAFEWFLKTLVGAGVRFDMIGMSHYPCWWDASKKKYTDWKNLTPTLIDNINEFYRTYGKKVMVCEVGMPVTEPETAAEMLSWLLEKTKDNEACAGVFYWEPEAPSGYNGGYDKGAFKDGKATAALAPFAD